MIWLTGAQGMLGREIALLFDEAGWEFVGSDRERDIADGASTAAFLDEVRPQWIVNAAAYTAVDRAEKEKAEAFNVNDRGPEILAQEAVKRGISLVHFSTDYVFSGEGTEPYREDDPTGPIQVYGKSKLAGERKVLESCPHALVLRISWLYGLYGQNFVAKILQLAREKDSLSVVADQWGSPTWARTLAESVVWRIAVPEGPWGLFHLSDEGAISWHHFAETIVQMAWERGLIDERKPVRPVSTEKYPTQVRRPRYSVLDKEKAKAAGFPVHPWRTNLGCYLDALKEKEGCR